MLPQAFLCVVFVLVLVQSAFAQSLFGASAKPKGPLLNQPTGALIESRSGAVGLFAPVVRARLNEAEGDETKPGPSLFLGRMQGSMFETITRKKTYDPTLAITHLGVKGLRDLIASAEAGKANYDAVQHGARIKPTKPPTDMTLNEIFDWIKATPGQPHAIGRYQMIPNTLRYVTKELGISGDTLYSPLVQDRCADYLLEQAGLSSFLSGTLGRRAFMNNIAKIWAGLPNDTGRSHYDGYAGNKAVFSWSHYEAQMARIFPRI